jgi:hypothetical protein
MLSGVEMQCRFVLKAYGYAAAAVQRRDAEGFWYSMQALLGAAAQIGRFLEADADLRAALRRRDGGAGVRGRQPQRNRKDGTPSLESSSVVHPVLP